MAPQTLGTKEDYAIYIRLILIEYARIFIKVTLTAILYGAFGSVPSYVCLRHFTQSKLSEEKLIKIVFVILFNLTWGYMQKQKIKIK